MANNKVQLHVVPEEPKPVPYVDPTDPWEDYDDSFPPKEVPVAHKLKLIAEAKVKALKAKAAAKKGQRKKGDNDYAVARMVVEGFKGPLSFCGANFRVFSEDEGWVVCDKELRRACHLACGRNADKTILPIIEAQLAVPSLEDTDRKSTRLNSSH